MLRVTGWVVTWLPTTSTSTWLNFTGLTCLLSFKCVLTYQKGVYLYYFCVLTKICIIRIVLYCFSDLNEIVPSLLGKSHFLNKYFNNRHLITVGHTKNLRHLSVRNTDLKFFKTASLTAFTLQAANNSGDGF